jgi:hypothetical protein
LVDRVAENPGKRDAILPGLFRPVAFIGISF